MIRVAELEVRRGGLRICSVAGLEVRAGERLGVVGPNGSGKTTLLLVLAGLEAPTSGRCEVEAAPRDRTYVHQQPYLFRGTALSNAAWGLRARGVVSAEATRLAGEWLERLGASHLAGRASASLSGGERRRVALARALALRPRLLLLDEPLAELDDSGAELVSRALAELPDATVLIAAPTPLPGSLVSRSHTLGLG